MADKWTNRFLDLAQTVASWSKDPNTCVGAVIADEAIMGGSQDEIDMFWLN